MVFESETAAILFIDPSHELFNKLTREEEDNMYESMKNDYGEYFGGTMEIREFKDEPNLVIDYLQLLISVAQSH